MTDSDDDFPNIAKLSLARDLCYFLDWALSVHGAQLSDLATGTILDVPDLVAEFVDIDQARLDEEMRRMRDAMHDDKLGSRMVN